MSTLPLTIRQTQILAVLRDAMKRKGYAPTVREIGSAVGLHSTSSVTNQLRELEDKGYIRRGVGPRALTILDPSESDQAAVNAEQTRIRKAIEDRKNQCVVGSTNCEYCAGLNQALQIVGGAS